MADTSCKKCENKTGISILPVRLTALAIDPQLAPPGAFALKPANDIGVALGAGLIPRKKSNLALRLLREEGFVYVYFPGATPNGQTSKWNIYKVSARAGLLPVGEFSLGQSEKACSKKPSHPHDLRTICIAEPDKVKTAWIGFSMNWWSEKVKNRMATSAKTRQAACMVEVQLNQGPPASGFEATEQALFTRVADYSLQRLQHAGVESAARFTTSDLSTSLQESQTLARVMQKQSTSSKPMVLGLFDPVGLAADLNGIRQARDKLFKDEGLKADTNGWPNVCNASLNTLQASMQMAGAMRAELQGHGTPISKSEWETRLKSLPYYQGYEWVPSAEGASVGHVELPGNSLQKRNVDRYGKRIGKLDWSGIQSQIDTGQREAWQKARDATFEKEATELGEYEADWLAAMKAKPTLDCFAHHYDPEDDTPPHAYFQPGRVYASESHLIHFPQPLSTKERREEYVKQTLDQAVVEEAAVALRALVGNQKAAITLMHEMLVGRWDRYSDENEGIPDNLRDKTYDFIKGLVPEAARLKYGWLTNAVMAFSAGQIAALSAAVTSLIQSKADIDKLEPRLTRTLQVVLVQQATESALGASRRGGTLDMPLLRKLDFDAKSALGLMAGSAATRAPTSAWMQSAEQCQQKVRMLVMVRLSEWNAAGGMPSTGDFEVRAENVRLLPNDKALALVKAQQQQAQALAAANEEIFKSNVEARLAIGGLIVQGLGMVWAVPKLWAALHAEKRNPAQLREAWLGVADGTSGLVAALAELAKAGLTMRLAKTGGKAAVVASMRLPVLWMAAALAGIAGGLINGMACADKAEGAAGKGDRDAASAYAAASRAFYVSVLPASTLTMQAGATVIARFLVRQGIVVGATVTALSELTVGGVAIGSAVSGLGVVLLGVGIVSLLVATQEPTELERWASGCYFGRSQRRTKFESLEKEQEGLEDALHPKPKEALKFDVEKVNEENRRLASKPGQTPVYGD
ncbi:T6SS effector BTH_I2691 family protein [Variovorax arabinosiphilus]|uniref:T6SS effector BTH_I2691 family protein n=1 Tax=Variovorax arabinosiphilus TaxID=3053498 RepID=UPI00257665A6|nr:MULTISPECIES: T6SS effector BTH_I2691 family protein [unclassified Variovorax]MDM0121803.1 T6SS effector BTH_I2691 family protein [Variovorax sp. J2L1-78]MDM0131667.1 T6SS effector BTH_I2691 family protein [Variovorax sp. J2L1-63]MDM0234566.1 T6SS effector BTH_I2691 family protein [Variovorax sp. J2R1-6]